MKNIKNQPLLSALFFLSLLTACSNKVSTSIDFNPNTNFSTLKTYQFSPTKANTPDINPILINHMQTVVDTVLSAQDLTKIAVDGNQNADITIKVTYSQQEKENNSSLTIGLGTGRVGSHGGASIGMNTNVPLKGQSKVITKIMIAISHNDIPVWYGTDSYEGDANSSTDESAPAIAFTIKKILKHFPPNKDQKSRVTTGFESVIL